MGQFLAQGDALCRLNVHQEKITPDHYYAVIDLASVLIIWRIISTTKV